MVVGCFLASVKKVLEPCLRYWNEVTVDETWETEIPESSGEQKGVAFWRDQVRSQQSVDRKCDSSVHQKPVDTLSTSQVNSERRSHQPHFPENHMLSRED